MQSGRARDSQSRHLKIGARERVDGSSVIGLARVGGVGFKNIVGAVGRHRGEKPADDVAVGRKHKIERPGSEGARGDFAIGGHAVVGRGIDQELGLVRVLNNDRVNEIVRHGPRAGVAQLPLDGHNRARRPVAGGCDRNAAHQQIGIRCQRRGDAGGSGIIELARAGSILLVDVVEEIGGDRHLERAGSVCAIGQAEVQLAAARLPGTNGSVQAGVIGERAIRDDLVSGDLADGDPVGEGNGRGRRAIVAKCPVHRKRLAGLQADGGGHGDIGHDKIDEIARVKKRNWRGRSDGNEIKSKGSERTEVGWATLDGKCVAAVLSEREGIHI